MTVALQYPGTYIGTRLRRVDNREVVLGVDLLDDGEFEKVAVCFDDKYSKPDHFGMEAIAAGLLAILGLWMEESLARVILRRKLRAERSVRPGEELYTVLDIDDTQDAKGKAGYFITSFARPSM